MLKNAVIITMMFVAILCQKTIAAEVSQSEVKAIIVKHSIELGVDPALGLSIAKTESNFRHNSRSPYGAIGVFQLMPSTARTMGINPYYLSDNIRGGLMYYKMMYKMFGSTELALAAYNAGPVAVKRNNKVVPKITRGFVNAIMSDYKNYLKNPDPAMVQARRKAPTVNSMPKPELTSKPSVKTSPSTSGKASLSKHQLEMINISEQKEAKNSLI